jgi:cellulose synthase/poly-beta-1,6-N-acetylglucosamine synthase-like glycosyltransferase
MVLKKLFRFEVSFRGRNTLRLFQSPQCAMSVELLGIPVLGTLVLVFLLTGLTISLFCAWKATKTSSTSKYFLIKRELLW